jgi:hypothetical protein
MSARLFAYCAPGVTLRETPGLAGLSWSFSTVAVCTLRAARTVPIGALLLYQSKRCRRIATCRNFLCATIRSYMVGSKNSPNWATT